MTYLELRTAVIANVIDVPGTVTSRVGYFVNRAIRKAQEKHNFLTQERLLTYTTTAGSITLGAGPANYRFKEFRGQPYYTPFVGRAVPIELAYNPLGDIYSPLDIGSPRLITMLNTSDLGVFNFQVFPYPDGNSEYADGEYRITIPYWRYVPDLVNDTDTNWFTIQAPDYIINKATYETFAAERDTENMTIWAQRAQNEYTDMLQTDKLAVLSRMSALVPQHQGPFQPMVR